MTDKEPQDNYTAKNNVESVRSQADFRQLPYQLLIQKADLKLLGPVAQIKPPDSQPKLISEKSSRFSAVSQNNQNPKKWIVLILVQQLEPKRLILNLRKGA